MPTVVAGWEPTTSSPPALRHWRPGGGTTPVVGSRRAIADDDSADARFGLATALWWLGDNRGSVEQATRAYAMFRRSGDVLRAVECALSLAITYKANFANTAVANGWTRRAERLLEGQPEGPAHAFVWLTRAYKMADLDTAEALTRRALGVSREAGDVDLELTAVSQLGLILVGKGDVAEGFSLIDEAMAGALAGEGMSLVTVAYTCCDMLNACELAATSRAAVEWCKVADGFVDTYGCPFLYAECRINYGSVLTATGRWVDADRELQTGLRITEGACPALHRRGAHPAGRAARPPGPARGRRRAAVRGRSRGGDRGGRLRSSSLEVTARPQLACSSDGAHARPSSRPGRGARPARRRPSGGGAGRRRGEGERAPDADRRDRRRRAAGGDGGMAAGRVHAPQRRRGRRRRRARTAVDTWSRLEMPFEAARAELDLARALAATEPRPGDRPRPRGAGDVRAARRDARRRSSRRPAAVDGRRRPHRAEGRRRAHGP